VENRGKPAQSTAAVLVGSVLNACIASASRVRQTVDVALATVAGDAVAIVVAIADGGLGITPCRFPPIRCS
jgi:hypothetical protein